jgi:hypothetical protein
MKSFHFDLGNSSEGPVGFCAVVKARTREDALALLKEALPSEQLVSDPYADADERGEVEYIQVYFNENAVTVDDIDSEDDTEDADEEEAVHA